VKVVTEMKEKKYAEEIDETMFSQGSVYLKEVLIADL
jgi:hypothetical protein